jgi:hypothetical protein
MHVADLHFTICLLAGLTEAACRDDDIPGVPPIGANSCFTFKTFL